MSDSDWAMSDVEFEEWAKRLREANDRQDLGKKKVYADAVPLEILEVAPGRCECGSESAGSGRHSTWCPKFEK